MSSEGGPTPRMSNRSKPDSFTNSAAFSPGGGRHRNRHQEPQGRPQQKQPRQSQQQQQPQQQQPKSSQYRRQQEQPQPPPQQQQHQQHRHRGESGTSRNTTVTSRNTTGTIRNTTATIRNTTGTSRNTTGTSRNTTTRAPTSTMYQTSSGGSGGAGVGSGRHHNHHHHHHHQNTSSRSSSNAMAHVGASTSAAVAAAAYRTRQRRADRIRVTQRASNGADLQIIESVESLETAQGDEQLSRFRGQLGHYNYDQLANQVAATELTIQGLVATLLNGEDLNPSASEEDEGDGTDGGTDGDSEDDYEGNGTTTFDDSEGSSHSGSMYSSGSGSCTDFSFESARSSSFDDSTRASTIDDSTRASTINTYQSNMSGPERGEVANIRSNPSLLSSNNTDVSRSASSSEDPLAPSTESSSVVHMNSSLTSFSNEESINAINRKMRPSLQSWQEDEEEDAANEVGATLAMESVVSQKSEGPEFEGVPEDASEAKTAECIQARVSSARTGTPTSLSTNGHTQHSATEKRGRDRDEEDLANSVISIASSGRSSLENHPHPYHPHAPVVEQHQTNIVAPSMASLPPNSSNGSSTTERTSTSRVADLLKSKQPQKHQPAVGKDSKLPQSPPTTMSPSTIGSSGSSSDPFSDSKELRMTKEDVSGLVPPNLGPSAAVIPLTARAAAPIPMPIPAPQPTATVSPRNAQQQAAATTTLSPRNINTNNSVSTGQPFNRKFPAQKPLSPMVTKPTTFTNTAAPPQTQQQVVQQATSSPSPSPPPPVTVQSNGTTDARLGAISSTGTNLTHGTRGTHDGAEADDECSSTLNSAPTSNTTKEESDVNCVASNLTVAATTMASEEIEGAASGTRSSVDDQENEITETHTNQNDDEIVYSANFAIGPHSSPSPSMRSCGSNLKNTYSGSQSRRRIPGGAGAKLLLVGPKPPDEEGSDGEEVKPLALEDPKVDDSLQEIEIAMQKARQEFSTGTEFNRRYQHGPKSAVQAFVMEEKSSFVEHRFLDRSECFYDTAAAAVSALLAPRDLQRTGTGMGYSAAPSGEITTAYSGQSVASSRIHGPPPKHLHPVSVFTAPDSINGAVVRPTGSYGSYGRNDVSVNLLTEETEKKLEGIKNRMSDPNKTLGDLLVAIASPDSGNAMDQGFMVRRKNACGALKVLTNDPKKRIKICWTVGVLPALTSVLADIGEDGIMSVFPERRLRAEYEAARDRAIACLSNLVVPKENRIPIFHTPNLIWALLRTVHEDRGAARKGCTAVLGFLSKTPDNRLILAQVPGFYDSIVSVLRPMPIRLEPKKPKEIATKKTFPWEEPSESEEEGSGVKRSIGSVTADEDSEKTPKIVSSKSPVEVSGYDETADELLRASRQNVFAVLGHLVKEKDNAYHFARNSPLLNTLIDISNHHESPSHILSIRLLANLTRHRMNSKVLVFQERRTVPALVYGANSESDETRLYACYAIQNLAQEKSCRQELAMVENLVPTLCNRGRFSQIDTERLAAISALKNLCDEPANLIPLTNTPECISTLMHLAHGKEEGVTETMQYRACDALATLSHWLRKIATSGKSLDDVHNGRVPDKKLFVPSLRVITWNQWH